MFVELALFSIFANDFYGHLPQQLQIPSEIDQTHTTGSYFVPDPVSIVEWTKFLAAENPQKPTRFALVGRSIRDNLNGFQRYLQRLGQQLRGIQDGYVIVFFRWLTHRSRILSGH
jgi:hypothetical protein